MTSIPMARTATLMSLLALAACSPPHAPKASADVDWPFYGGDAGGQRFSSAGQITPANVGGLKIAWTYSTGEMTRHGEQLRHAAFENTPILAAGAGKVSMAGPNGGYGLYVKLQHTKDIGTAYAHMSRIGPGIKPGVAVRQGQVLGFVGSTGMSTGPHLHYEFHRGGKQVNPLAQKFAMRAAVGGKAATRFQALAKQYLAQMKNAPVVADTKPAKPKEPAAPQVAKGD